jgi:hypothetical protein
MSMPTPRPLMLETAAAVVRPGAKIRLSICSSLSCWSRRTISFSIARARTF